MLFLCRVSLPKSPIVFLFDPGFRLVSNHNDLDGEPVPVNTFYRRNVWTQCGQLCWILSYRVTEQISIQISDTKFWIQDKEHLKLILVYYPGRVIFHFVQGQSILFSYTFVIKELFYFGDY